MGLLVLVANDPTNFDKNIITLSKSSWNQVWSSTLDYITCQLIIIIY